MIIRSVCATRLKLWEQFQLDEGGPVFTAQEIRSHDEQIDVKIEDGWCVLHPETVIRIVIAKYVSMPNPALLERDLAQAACEIESQRQPARRVRPKPDLTYYDRRR